MHYYKLTLQYAGGNYAGFQWQNGPHTIQKELNLNLEKMISGKVTTMGASRTDTGVHALMQIVRVTCEEEIKEDSFLEQINTLLPLDIRVLTIEKTVQEFKPTSGTLSKEYRYFFTNDKVVSPERSKFIANISNPLDINLIKECINHLQGKHDFVNFYSAGSNVKSSSRTIFLCELQEINPHHFFNNSLLFSIPEDLTKAYELKIIADGFLKQMIRHIVSGLWMVGSGKMPKEEFIKLIDGPKQQKQLWKVASANGLYLTKINY